MRLHRKRKLIKQRKLPTICEKNTIIWRLFTKTVMFLCVFCVYKKVAFSHVKTHTFAPPIETHKTPKLHWISKKTTIFDKNVNVLSLFYVGPGSIVNTDK